MSYEFYKIAHLASLACLLLGFGLMIGIFSEKLNPTRAARKWAFAMHGIGITLMLVSGFGLAARLQMFQNLPMWIYAKLAVWLILGGMVALIKRKPNWRFPIILSINFLVGFAAWLAVTKPWQ